MFATILDQPITEKHNETGNWRDLRYGFACMQGWRTENEDTHSIVLGLPGSFKDWAFFAVFDGHVGDFIANHCAANLLDSIITETKKVSDHNDDHDEVLTMTEKMKAATRDGFMELDKKMENLPQVQSGMDRSGSTAVCALISPSDLYIANLGDSRALLCRRDRLNFATKDHKPEDPEEKMRIENAFGCVGYDGRINGDLAMSRAFGDFQYKTVSTLDQTLQKVTPVPDVTHIIRVPNDDEYLILACDGIWDVMTNEDLIKFVGPRLRANNDLASVCNQVADACLDKESYDNMSIVLVTFPACPKPKANGV